jgi:hypothetical protein
MRGTDGILPSIPNFREHAPPGGNAISLPTPITLYEKSNNVFAKPQRTGHPLFDDSSSGQGMHQDPWNVKSWKKLTN